MGSAKTALPALLTMMKTMTLEPMEAQVLEAQVLEAQVQAQMVMCRVRTSVMTGLGTVTSALALLRPCYASFLAHHTWYTIH